MCIVRRKIVIQKKHWKKKQEKGGPRQTMCMMTEEVECDVRKTNIRRLGTEIEDARPRMASVRQDYRIVVLLNE